MDNKINISCSMISISEFENDPTRRLAKFLICPLDVGNGNGKGIKETDLSEEEMNTLVGQPLVTKVVYDSKTKTYDFSGHLMKKKYEYVDGKLVKYSDFQSTNPIGYHTEVSIEDVEVDGETKRCLVANCILWTRYRNAMSVIDRLGTDLRTSWEVSYYDSYEENGVIWLKDIRFLANCLLSPKVVPAYPLAGLLEVAEEEIEETEEDELSVAMIKDMNEELSSQSDDVSVEDIEENKGGEKMEGKGKVENSALTTGDLCSRIRKAVYSTEGNGRYYYNVLVYPFDFVAYAKIEGGDAKEEDWSKFTFTVNSDDTVSITSSEDVQMVFIPKSNQEEAIAELEEKVKNAETSLSEKETELSEKLGEIIKLGETIKGLETTVSELQPYKEKVEEAEAKAKEEEAKKKKEELCESLTKDGFFTQEEVSSNEEIQTAISEMDENKIKLILAERIIEKNTEKASKEEVSEKEEKVETSTDINAEMQCDYSDVDTSLNWLQSRRNRRR